MSATDNEDRTSVTGHYPNDESSSSSKASSLSYLKLEHTRKTSFRWNGETYTVADAPASVFDAFIAVVVEQIINVDRSAWNIHDRWNIVNACLQAEVLTLTEDFGDGLQLAYPDEAEHRLAAPPPSGRNEDPPIDMQAPGFLQDVERARRQL